MIFDVRAVAQEQAREQARRNLEAAKKKLKKSRNMLGLLVIRIIGGLGKVIALL